MIIECSNCGVKFNDQTIINCPICIYHKEEKDAVNFNHEVSALKHMVSNSLKGKPRKTPSGMSIIYVNKKSYYLPKTLYF